MAKFKTHYDTLSVSRNAPLSVIKAAYKALSQNYHPDKYSGGLNEALRIIKDINGAYEILSDSDKRVEHDQWIFKKEKEYASFEAQRIMDTFKKTYLALPDVEQKSYPADFFTGIKNNWENLGVFLNQLGVKMTVTASKKIFRFVGFVIVVASLLAINKDYIYAPEPTPALKIQTPQEISELLVSANQLVKQGEMTKAFSLYSQLAEQGNAEAQTRLGFMYATGKGVEQNYNTAVDWCYKAAQQGDSIAQYNLGLMYAKGQGVAQDNKIALAWYSKAAEQGHAQAQFSLGGVFEKGVGVEKNKKQAADLYLKAANQGLAEAALALKKLDNERK